MKAKGYNKNLYTIIVIMLPILSIYKSPIPNMDLATLLLFSSFAYIMIRGNKIYKGFPKEWTMYLLYVIISIVLIYPFVAKEQSYNYIVLRGVKYILYMVIGIYSAVNGIFNAKIGFKLYKIISITTIVILYVQTAIYRGFGIAIYGVFPKLIQLQSYAQRFENKAVGFRPTSIFLEPSHFFDYTMLLLLYALFREQNAKIKDYYLALFVSVGMVLSTSGQAVLFVILAWIFFLILLIMKLNRRNIILISALLITAPTLLFVLRDNVVIQGILNRIFNPHALGGNAVQARSLGYIYFSELSAIRKIFGSGYGNTPNIFFSSMSFNLYALGIVGTLFIINIYYKAFKYVKSKYLKILVAALLIVSFGNTTFMSVNAVFFFSFIYAGFYQKRDIFKNDIQIVIKPSG